MIFGCCRRVRVVEITRGPKKTKVSLYYGRTELLHWDPGKLIWKTGRKPTPFMNYTSKMARDLLAKRITVPNPVTRKWSGVLPADFTLVWKSVWSKERTSKEAGLLWLIWHRAVAVNHWRGRTDRAIDICCPVCPRRSEETVMHRFWECASAQHAWQWSIHIMNTLVHGKEARGPWRSLTWKQGIFSSQIPRKFNHVKRIWLEIRTVVLWSLWLERNDRAFNNITWSMERMRHAIWTGMIDYGRVEWDGIRLKKKLSLDARAELRACFRRKRGLFEIFATFVDDLPLWQPVGPMAGFVFIPH